ncbi:MAG: hypothetical protein WCM93_12725 [Bacteroidota bacterium]
MAIGIFILPLPLPTDLSEYALLDDVQSPLTADVDYLTPGTASSTYEPIKGSDDNFVTDAEKSNLHAPGSDNQTLPTALSDLSDDSTHRLVTDTEKSTWNAKQPAGSYLVAADIANKVDKITGKGLSTNDYTTAEQTKLSGIEANANNYSHPSNHAASVITQDSSNRFVSDTEKSTWNGKISSVAYANIASDLTSIQSVSALNIDWSSGAIFTKTLTAATTLTFSNLQLNKVISFIVTGNFTLTLPTSCKRIGGSYSGAVSNYIQFHCTNTSTPEVWYSINPAL